MSGASPKRVVLVGDSTLDNVVWVHHDGGLSVTDHLKSRGFTVVNFAADGFTSGQVLEGGAATISKKARAEVGDPFPPGPVFQPLR